MNSDERATLVEHLEHQVHDELNRRPLTDDEMSAALREKVSSRRQMLVGRLGDPRYHREDPK